MGKIRNTCGDAPVFMHTATSKHMFPNTVGIQPNRLKSSTSLSSIVEPCEPWQRYNGLLRIHAPIVRALVLFWGQHTLPPFPPLPHVKTFFFPIKSPTRNSRTLWHVTLTVNATGWPCFKFMNESTADMYEWAHYSFSLCLLHRPGTS